MLLASFMKLSEYCSKVEPLFVIAPESFSKYPPRESTISFVRAVTWSTVPKFTAFLAALDVSAAEAMHPKRFYLLPPNAGFAPVGNIYLLVRGLQRSHLQEAGASLFKCLVLSG